MAVNAVLLEFVTRLAPEARVFTLDTGVLFPETYAAWREAEERYGITVESWRGEWVDGLWAVDLERCCGMRKRTGRRTAWGCFYLVIILT